ncbi:MAG TPA: CDP-alcohol phosphatidyltransferase family protein [Actinoplanes sp.]|nr:CDP-alcohol phosphatidyltransferase family protein [Actinoplanes sp.]
MTQRPSLAEVRERTYKRRDAWWTVWLVDPLAGPLVRLVSPWKWATPNLLSLGAFVVGLGSAAAFWRADYPSLLLGALLFHLAFVLDCMDGKIARLNGTGSLFGSWLDYVFDRLRVLTCALALFGGQWHKTGEPFFLWLAVFVIFLDMFRYLNALQMQKVKLTMKERILEVAGASAEYLEESEEEISDAPPPNEATIDVHGDFKTKFSAFVRLRNFLLRQRIRAHLFSGIEFMMFVFIIGPVVGQIAVVTIASGLLLVAFEALLVYKLWTTTRTYARRMAKLQREQVPALS